MLPPRKVKFEAKKRERENLEFRTFLKCNADEKELDEQFAALHEELFENYDCNKCRNCCKMYHGSIPTAEIEKDALYLGISSENFIEQYLQGKDSEGNYQTKNSPCDFLQTDGVANWENVSQKIVKIILILINRNVCGAYIVYWMLLEYARWLLKSTKG